MFAFAFFDEMVKIATSGQTKQAYYVSDAPLLHRALDTLMANKGLVLAGAGGIVGYNALKQYQQNAAMGKYLREQQKQPPMMSVA